MGTNMKIHEKIGVVCIYGMTANVLFSVVIYTLVHTNIFSEHGNKIAMYVMDVLCILLITQLILYLSCILIAILRDDENE